MAETKNVYISFSSSLLIHSLIFGFYLYLNQLRKTNLIILENIELIEIEQDETIVQKMPRQIPPKTILDFVKMAMPVFKKPKPQSQEIAEPEIDRKLIEKVPEKIHLDKTLNTRPESQISLTQKKHVSSEKLSEIIPETESAKRPELAMLSSQEPAIDLAEVGKIAVGETSISQPISLKKKTVPVLRDFKQGDVTKAKTSDSYKPSTLKGAKISIEKKISPAVSKPTLGYGKGISLTNQRRNLPRELEVAPSVTRIVEKTPIGVIKETKPDKKSVEISGQIVGRKIISSYLPVYPDWARAANIEADVVIRFYVSPQGEVREKLYLERTSGYTKLDQLAMDALRKWVFESLKTTGDQWGIITFRYLLR